MLYIFDKDGTLCRSKSGKTFINSIEDQELIPGVLEKIEELKEQEHTIGIVSNQGGVAFDYLTYQEAEKIMMHIAELIGTSDYYFCPYHPDGINPDYSIDSIYRKPNPGMIMGFAIITGYENPKDILYIGDRPEDEEAAKRAGVNFIWSDEFFGWDNECS